MPEAPDPARAVAVVVGASGGIGGALGAALRDDPRFAHVVALSRQRPAGWPDADEARSWRAVDILDEASLAEGAAHCGARGVVTRIIVASGLLQAPGVAPEKAMRDLDAEGLARLFAVNAIGPALAAKHLLPLTPRDRPSVFAALSARVGSIADNRLGGWYGYRAAKAGLNQIVHTLAIEHSRTRPQGVCVALHPGTVRTRLSAPFTDRTGAAQAVSPEAAAANLLAVLDRLQPSDSGGFFAWDGAPIPW